MAKPKVKLFDPATDSNVHIVEYTTQGHQTIEIVRSEKDAVEIMRQKLVNAGIYTHSFRLRRLHIITGRTSYTTYRRELYERLIHETTGIDADLNSIAIECPITFRDELQPPT